MYQFVNGGLAMNRRTVLSLICLFFSFNGLINALAKNPVVKPVLTKQEEALNGSYKITLINDITKEECGSIQFSRTDKTGYISLLQVNAQHQNKGYGAVLFSMASIILTEKGCEKITWQAVPFTAPSDKRIDQFKRLETFYKGCGGMVTGYTGFMNKNPISATMEYSIPKIA
ncbi:MAG: GNAT family N-acetyltransferase, partial [Hydrogenophaga sp.]|nr:GNAT family N-acetyltransferase [Hydrogenophaga sp.]